MSLHINRYEFLRKKKTQRKTLIRGEWCECVISSLLMYVLPKVSLVVRIVDRSDKFSITHIYTPTHTWKANGFGDYPYGWQEIFTRLGILLSYGPVILGARLRHSFATNIKRINLLEPFETHTQKKNRYQIVEQKN